MSVEATLATWRLPKTRITSSEKLFLLACANRAGESHECWPSLKRLCEDTGLDRKTIIIVRKSVIDKGLLLYTGSFRGKSGQIPVMQLTYVDDSVSEFSEKPPVSDKNMNNSNIATGTENGTGTGTENGTGNQYRKRYSESKRENLKEEPNKTPISPYGESVFFEQFWTLYPVKKSKKTCLQKWKRLGLDKIADKILQKIEQQKLNDKSWLAGFIPHPMTYINQERWNDEIDIQTRGGTGKRKAADSFTQFMNSQKKNGNTYDQQGNAYDPFR